MGQIYGAPVAYYRPDRFAYATYRPFYQRFAVPLALASVVTVGAVAAVAFASQTTQYHAPMALMGEMQFPPGFEVGYGYSPS